MHTPKTQIQGIEPRKRRLGIRTIPSIFGEEKNQEALICFVSVFVCKNVFGREEMCRKCEIMCLGPFIALARITR